MTIPELCARKRLGRKIVMATAYDALQAEYAEEAGIDIVLVGDSAANVVHGHETTLPITMDEMIAHTRAASRGRRRALLVGDMPFLSYQVSIPEAIRNAGRFLKEGFADAVKLEGGAEIAPTVRALVDAAIPVMGHVGLTPQSVHRFGGYKVQGRDAGRAGEILEGARRLEAAGAFAVVLECVPRELAALVTSALSIPTIGIGAGPDCDGQVLVFHDLLGLTRNKPPRFVKRYAELGQAAVEALRRFRREVEEGIFPGPEHGYGMEGAELTKLKDGLLADRGFLGSSGAVPVRVDREVCGPTPGEDEA